MSQTKKQTKTKGAKKAAAKAKPEVEAKVPKPEATAKPATAKPAGKAKAAPKAKPLSCLGAAEVVLRGNGGQPMRCADMIAAMVGQGLWSTKAPTPAATLYSAILREIEKKGDQARFAKADRGLFGLAAGRRA